MIQERKGGERIKSTPEALFSEKYDNKQAWEIDINDTDY